MLKVQNGSLIASEILSLSKVLYHVVFHLVKNRFENVNLRFVGIDWPGMTVSSSLVVIKSVWLLKITSHMENIGQEDLQSNYPVGLLAILLMLLLMSPHSWAVFQSRSQIFWMIL